MKLEKAKYKKDEVQKLLNELQAEKDALINDKDEKILQLKEENAKLLSQVECAERDADIIKNAVIDAEREAQAVRNQIQLEYQLETEKLKLFFLRWNSYFNYLVKTYPNYAVTEKVMRIKKKLVELFGDHNGKEIINQLDEQVAGEVAVTTAPFNPQAKIDAYIKSESGFDMNQVLYPDQKDLDLSDLCKELGLME